MSLKKNEKAEVTLEEKWKTMQTCNKDWPQSGTQIIGQGTFKMFKGFFVCVLDINFIWQFFWTVFFRKLVEMAKSAKPQYTKLR